jgi:hypothetical protein
MRSIPTAPVVAAAVAALLLAGGCRKQPTIEEVPASAYHEPSTSQTASP